MMDSLKSLIEAEHAALERHNAIWALAVSKDRLSPEWKARNVAWDAVQDARDDLKRALRGAIGLD